jgi:hypothetical protein
MYLFEICTCFEHIVLIIRRDKLYQYNLSYLSLGMVTVYFRPAHDTVTDTQ